jgi:hypothetical protein
VIIHPEITFAVSQVSQFNSNPGKKHWAAVQRIFGYLKKAKRLPLVFKAEASVRNNSRISVDAYSDANWAGDPHTRRSQSGYLVQFNGNTISWSSKKQNVISLSSCESETIASSNGATELMWLRKLITELFVETIGLKVDYTLYLDNKAAIDYAKNSNNHSRMKHIDIRHKFIKLAADQGHFALQYVASANQLADILTKPLGPNIFIPLRSRIMNSDSQLCPVAQQSKKTKLSP